MKKKRTQDQRETEIRQYSNAKENTHADWFKIVSTKQ